MGKGAASRTAGHRVRVLLAFWVVAAAAAPAHADLRGALADYKKGDYTHAFQEFLALAKLGQPVAQFSVAEMYHAGRGTDWSDIHAYAWASLAAANGEARANALLDQIRPKLAPGSERIAGWIAAPYTRAALEQTLLPALSSESAPAPGAAALDPMTDCNRRVAHAYLAPYPKRALNMGAGGTVIVEFTLMPDGTSRFPRVVYAVPAGIFEGAVKESMLRIRFASAPPGSSPVQCSVPYSFRSGEGDEQPFDIPKKVEAQAQAGDPGAQQLYGLLLDGEPLTQEQIRAARKQGMPHPGIGVAGLPWLVKAAQGGMPVAQYEVAHDLFAGSGCLRDPAKALRWLQMAADQDQPNAEITLATRLLHGTPSAADVAQAKAWLERAANQQTEDASQDAQLLLAAILAATPQSSLRDPRRALDLLDQLRGYYEQPIVPEIRAAAQAAEGDFAGAVRSERTALRMARGLRWNLAPLEQRLSAYESHRAWYGSLLEF